MKKYPSKVPKNVNDFFKKGGYAFLKEIEEKYDCASICKVPMFYMARDVRDGRPIRECIRGIYDDIKGKMKIEAFFCFFTAFILVCAIISGVVICKGPESMMDDEDWDKLEYEKKQ
jgi:hypothetical protein